MKLTESMLKNMIRRAMGNYKEPRDHPNRDEVPQEVKEMLFQIFVEKGFADAERHSPDGVLGYRIPKDEVEDYRQKGWAIVEFEGESYTGEY